MLFVQYMFTYNPVPTKLQIDDSDVKLRASKLKIKFTGEPDES